MRETFIPRSDNIDSVQYDSDSQTMQITFKSGAAWEYQNVPQATFMGIQNAPSAGSYFYKNIRSVFNGTEV